MIICTATSTTATPSRCTPPGVTVDRCHAVLTRWRPTVGGLCGDDRRRQPRLPPMGRSPASRITNTPHPDAGCIPARAWGRRRRRDHPAGLLGRDEPSRTAAATAAETDRTGLPAGSSSCSTPAPGPGRGAGRPTNTPRAAARQRLRGAGRAHRRSAGAVGAFVCAATARAPGPSGLCRPARRPCR